MIVLKNVQHYVKDAVQLTTFSDSYGSSHLRGNSTIAGKHQCGRTSAGEDRISTLMTFYRDLAEKTD